MKKRLAQLVAILAVFLLPILAQAKAPIEGRWDTSKDGGIVEISVKGGTLEGKLVDSDHPKAKMGILILRDFHKEGDTWVGKIYAPKKDRTLPAKLTLKGDTIKIHVSAGAMTKKITWKRARGG